MKAEIITSITNKLADLDNLCAPYDEAKVMLMRTEISNIRVDFIKLMDELL